VSAETGTQKWDKEQRPETAVMKREGIQHDPQGYPKAGVCKANSWILCRVTKDQGLDIVEGSAPSETERETAHGVGARNVGALATRDSFAPTV
jgi:hypothetical protein